MIASSTIVEIRASSRFDAGPARVTRLSSRRIFHKLRVITGVGFAQPIKTPLNMLMPMSGPKMMMAGSSRVPIGSM